MKTITAYETSDGTMFALKQDAAYHERCLSLTNFFQDHIDDAGGAFSAARKAILDNHKEFMEMMHAAPADDVYDEEPA